MYHSSFIILHSSFPFPFPVYQFPYDDSIVADIFTASAKPQAAIFRLQISYLNLKSQISNPLKPPML